MPVNLHKPHRWKADIAQSVKAYNQWFLTRAPKAFRDQRRVATSQIRDAMAATSDLTRIDAATLENHPAILPSLRMAACPPLARDRLTGLAQVPRSMVLTMEHDKTLPPRMPPAELYLNLTRISQVLSSVVDHDICPWIPDGRTPAGDEGRIAAVVIADRLCGMTANPIIRNAQERRQLEHIARWLEQRDYERIPAGDPQDPASMPPASFSFRMNVKGWLDEHGVNTVMIPVDAVIKPKGAAPDELPLFVEAKSAGDFANVNKRRKEEAIRAGQLRRRLGPNVRVVLFLGGYFDSGYLGYEAAEGIDWVWEHRIDDFSGFGL